MLFHHWQKDLGLEIRVVSCRSTVKQALRVKWRVFGVFVCFGLYFVNYRSWQAEICKSMLKDVFK